MLADEDVRPEDTDDSAHCQSRHIAVCIWLVLTKEVHTVLTIVVVIDGNVAVRCLAAVGPNAHITGFQFSLETNVRAELEDAIAGPLIRNILYITGLTAMDGVTTDIRKLQAGDQVPALVGLSCGETVHIHRFVQIFCFKIRIALCHYRSPSTAKGPPL